MCGIVGYVGPQKAVPLLMDGLKRLEYRGYESAGVAAVFNKSLLIQKAAGKIATLESQLKGDILQATTGIAHTRWATHGAPTTKNAHPHSDCGGTAAVVHNGIIENATSLRTMLVERGHRFVSDTDTEVIAHLIEQFYTGTLEDAVGAALRELEGAYGIAVVSSREPDTMVAARQGSPLLIAIGNGENFTAPDPSPVPP